jgi:hypothetical protein
VTTLAGTLYGPSWLARVQARPKGRKRALRRFEGVSVVEQFRVTRTPYSGLPAFMSRPSSSYFNINGGTTVLIENKSFQGGSLDAVSGKAIQIANVNGNITIRNCDFSDLLGCVYLVDCTGTLIIEGLRGRNTGNRGIGVGDIGAGASNYIQMNRCEFTGAIRNNKFLGGMTEDMISFHASGGVGPGQEFIVENNALQGLVTSTATARAWASNSGTGIILGDGVGDPRNGYVIVRYNTFLTPGQVGINHIDGPGLQTYENIVYAQQRPLNNNSIVSYLGNPSGSCHDNEYYWINNDGSTPDPWNGAGTMSYTSNVENASLNPADYVVVL